MTIGVDLRDALRSLRLRPGWTAAAVLTLAAGIGANATMFRSSTGSSFGPRRT